MGSVRLPTKFGNRKVVTDDGTFDSQGEMARWRELQLEERAGRITDLERQVAYELLPRLQMPGQRTEQRIVLWVDFEYQEHGRTIVEDFKGVETPTWRLKRRLFLHRYPHVELRISGGRR